MEKLFAQLNPKNQNTIQRRGFGIGLAVIFICLLVHFPFNGYDNEHIVTTYKGYVNCPHPTLEEGLNMTTEASTQYIEDLNRCRDKSEFQELPFREWKSKGAMLSWFASPTHTITGVSFIIFLTLLWLLVFKDYEIN
jgi:hypothetical protein